MTHSISIVHCSRRRSPSRAPFEGRGRAPALRARGTLQSAAGTTPEPRVTAVRLTDGRVVIDRLAQSDPDLHGGSLQIWIDGVLVAAFDGLAVPLRAARPSASLSSLQYRSRL